jgi:hypothetical protein
MTDVTSMTRIADALERLSNVAEAKLVYGETLAITHLAELALRHDRVRAAYISFNNHYLASSRATADDKAKAQLEVDEALEDVKVFGDRHPLLKKIMRLYPQH